MTDSPEAIKIRDDFVRELISPDIAYRPFGKEDNLSDYLYRPMKESGSTERMKSFIDATGEHIDKESMDDEYNALKLHRTMVLLADMPPEIPEEQRLDAWEYFLDKDWTHIHRGIMDLEHVMGEMARENPGYAEKVKARFAEVTERKQAELSDLVPAGVMPDIITADDFDVDAAIEGEVRLRREFPEALELGMAITRMIMTQRSLRRQNGSRVSRDI